MEDIGISHHPRRKPNGITKADREARKSEDLLKRDFKSEKPLAKCVTDKELEEERRMFYVAMTRAKEHLFIFYVYEKEAGNFLPSRFIGEITCEA